MRNYVVREAVVLEDIFEIKVCCFLSGDIGCGGTEVGYLCKSVDADKNSAESFGWRKFHNEIHGDCGPGR